MNSLEWRAVGGLALVQALRMLGMFMVLPVFSLYARDLPGGASGLEIGFALGVYGLAQALLQIPLGIASDRYGRKPVIVGSLLVFVAGSLIAAASHDIHWIIFGRLVQGAGALSAAASALVADITRESVRAQAMAIIGVGMGASFVLALVLGPLLAAWQGVNGIFALTAALAALAIPLVIWGVPDAPAIPRAPVRLRQALAEPALLRLNAGILLLSAGMTMLFIAAPLALEKTLHLALASHWQVYLPVLALSLPPAFWLMRRHQTARLMQCAFALLAAALLLAAASSQRPHELLLALLLYFTAFNFLEGVLPAQVSQQAAPAGKGAALGVYATCQFLGGFSGGVLGGFALGHFGPPGVFACAAALPLLWLTFSFRRFNIRRLTWHAESTR